MICQICMKECDEKIPFADYDEDETHNDIAVEVESTISIDTRIHKVKGIMCALCMREGKKLPVPKVELAKSVEDERRERLARLASKHGARSARDAFRLYEEATTPPESELDRLLGKTTPSSTRLTSDVLIVDDPEDEDDVSSMEW